MKTRIGIIGVGTAGIVNLSYFLSAAGNDYEIVSIYDPSIPILGIGESTNPGFIRTLEHGTRFSISEDTQHLDSTYKFGTQFINWREHDWLNPLIGGGIAVHFNNFKLKEFAFERFAKLWPQKFSVIEGTVDKIIDKFNSVKLVINGQEELFDYVIDCSGFPKDYSEDYVQSSCSLLNHCYVHSFEKFDPVPYTEHIATQNGWMFGIPLQTRKTYGYLFNDTITSEEDAKKDMAATLNISVNELKLKEYRFKPYYTTRVVNNNILKNGNQALFFEPISATSINQYVSTCHILFDYVMGEISEDQANAKFVQESNITEDIINYYYHGGTNFDSPFWQAAKANAINNLKGNERFKVILDQTQLANEIGLPYNGPAHLFTAYSLQIIDEGFGYNYFKGAPRPFDNTDKV